MKKLTRVACATAGIALAASCAYNVYSHLPVKMPNENWQRYSLCAAAQERVREDISSLETHIGKNMELITSTTPETGRAYGGEVDKMAELKSADESLTKEILRLEQTPEVAYKLKQSKWVNNYVFPDVLGFFSGIALGAFGLGLGKKLR